MRKIFLSALLLLISFCFLQAQTNCGDTIYYFDFDSGIPANWINQGDKPASLWEYRGPNTNPDTSVGSRGAFSLNNGPLKSSTSNNGFVIFDSDYLDNGGNSQSMGQGPSPAPHFGALYTQPLNFSNYFEVSISLKSFARTFYSRQWIIISTNGGLNFTDSIRLHSDLNINNTSDNPTVYSINISAQVGGKNNVVIGFIFDGTFGNASQGYYFWQFDDLLFSHIKPYDYALEDEKINHGNKKAFYGTLPINETEEIKVSGLAKNLSPLTTFNNNLVVLQKKLTKTDSFSTPVGLIIPGDTLSVNASTNLIANDTGWYHTTTMFLGDSFDCAFENNVHEYTYKVSPKNGKYALDYGKVSSFLGTNSFTGGEDYFKMLNLYEFTDTFLLTHVWVRISQITTDSAKAHVIIFDSTGATFGGGGGFVNEINPFYKSPPYYFSKKDILSGYASIPVYVKIPPGGFYIGLEAFSNNNVDTIRVAIDESVYQNPYASVIGILNMGLYTNPDAFLIRLNEFICDTNDISIVGSVIDNQFVASIVNVQITGGTPPYSHFWKGPNLFASTSLNLNTVITIQGNYSITVVDSKGCIKDEEFTVIPRNVPEEKFISNFKVFPNPSKGIFTIEAKELKEVVQIEVFNMAGQKVYFNKLSFIEAQSLPIDLNFLPPGNYQLNISNKNLSTSEQLVITK